MTLPNHASTVGERSRALIMVAGSDDIDFDTRMQLSQHLLPHTAKGVVCSIVADIRYHLRQAAIYAEATPSQAQRWFCDPDCVHEATVPAYIECLDDRARMAKGEAEVLALNAALSDRQAFADNDHNWLPGWINTA